MDWNQSVAYCQWRGAQLPTEAQWEYAARGSEGRAYPWGNAAPAEQLCWSGIALRSSTCPVQSFPSGNTPTGLADMSGNVDEWTADWQAPYTSAAGVTDPTGPATGSDRIERGGGWEHNTPNQVHAAQRAWNRPTYRDELKGFRCAPAPR